MGSKYKAEGLNPEYRNTIKSDSIRSYVVVFTVSLLAAFLLRAFVFQLYYIPSESMEQTLMVGDKIAVVKVHPEVKRGDIVVFKDPGGWLEGYPTNDDKLIKRVIGVPGDTVECCDASGKLLLNGEPLDEPYLAKGVSPSETEFKIRVKEGHLWVMGDNRADSGDSRYNEISQVPVGNVEGIALLKVWPSLETLE